MGDLFLLSGRQMARISSYLAPVGYGPHKTLYNRFIRWSRLGVFDRIFAGRADEGPKPERIMIDATHLMAYRTAASLLKRGMFPVVSGEPRVG